MDETIIVHGMPDETELAALIVVLKIMAQRAATQRVLAAGATSWNEGAGYPAANSRAYRGESPFY